MQKRTKIIAFSGSGRKNGNTARLIREVFSVLEAAGGDTELIQMAGEDVRGCTACYKCFETKDQRCYRENDANAEKINSWIAKMVEADAIILGSPSYFADVSPELKALIDRAGMTARANKNMLRRKVGAAVVAERRAGGLHTFDTINHFFLISGMIVPGSSYWNVGRGRQPNEVEQDEEGMQTMRDLGEAMVWLLSRLRA